MTTKTTTQLERRSQEFELGAPVEVAYRNYGFGQQQQNRTARGRFGGYSRSREGIYVEIGGTPHFFMEENVRYLSPLDPMLHTASFREGDAVWITKYGNQYHGIVRGVYKTRLEVEFKTKGGKTKLRMIPAIDCERVGR